MSGFAARAQLKNCPAMNEKKIIAIGFSAALIILACAGYRILTLPVAIGRHAADGLKYTIDKCSEVAESLGQVKTSFSSQNDCLEVKPISELSFSRIRVRSVLKYENEVLGSEKVIIADQAFDIRLGWSGSDDIRMVVATNSNQPGVRIFAPPPHYLTLTRVDQTPDILFREDGLINKLTPEDEIEVETQLQHNAFKSADWQEGQKVAKEGFEKFLRGLFQMQGLTNVEIIYNGQNISINSSGL